MSRGVRTPEEKRAEILRLHDEGRSTTEIARTVGTTRETARRVIQASARDLTRTLVTPELIQQVIDLRSFGHTYPKISERTGLAVVTIGRIVNGHHHLARTAGQQDRSGPSGVVITPEIAERIRELRLEGHSIATVARLVGVHLSTVGSFLRRDAATQLDEPEGRRCSNQDCDAAVTAEAPICSACLPRFERWQVKPASRAEIEHYANERRVG